MSLLSCAGLLSMQSDAVMAQEVIPDFYQEPGIQQNRAYFGQHFAEHIDPFTGGLKLSYVDVRVPGNGGLDIEVVRSYSSGSVDPTNPAAYTAGGGNLAGVGWTVHFGRVLKKTTNASDLCANLNTLTVEDNPTLETPDGSRHLLVWVPGASSSSSPMALTNDRWRADCVVSATGGMKIYSPDGLRYDMTQLVQVGSGTASIYAWYTTRITDRNGNYLDINYAASSSPQISSVVASDGRRVDFSYDDSGQLTRRISSISANGATYSYNYTAPTGWSGVYQLTSVTRPGGTSWSYAYNGDMGASAGSYLLRRLTYPEGGTVSYTYGYESFDYQTPSWRSHVIKTKSTSDGGDWSFAFTPSSGTGVNDKTVVTTPVGTITYVHVGANTVTSGSIWKVGLLLSKQEGSRTETLTWTKQKISNETYLRPGQFVTQRDTGETNAPVLQSREVTLNGADHTTTYSDFNSYGNPGTVTESGPNNGSRTTTLTYYTNSSKWIVRQVKDQTVTGGVSVTRTFDTDGNLESISKDGVTTSYAYDSQGNVSSATFPRGLTHNYSSYKRGVPRTETQPESVSISRVVSDAGNITSETNGESNTTTYSYDGLNRVTKITPPRGSSVSISYGTTSKTATRGTLTESTSYDAFGRAKTVTLEGISRTYRYDSLGRMTFASNPGSSSAGTEYLYDALGRVTKITNADGTSRSISYGSGTKTVTDERGKATTFSYRSYGEPSTDLLTGVSAPESSASISISRNGKDLVTTLTQNGVSRTYGYNSSGYLTQVINPETGTTTYGRDAAGNMTSKQIGSSGTTAYTYDNQNRLTSINYPGTAASVTKTYSKTHKLKTVTSSVASKVYGYDDNDNVTSESLTVDGIAFNTSYTYNSLDQLSSITYPRSNRVVGYSPNSLGRPTAVSGFVTSVTYWSSGQVKQIDYANNTVTTYDQNSRLWPRTFETHKSLSASYVDSTYGYDGVGNLTSISDSADSSYSRTLGYDDINRLTSISGPWGAGSINYSGRGNISSQSLGSSSLFYSYDTKNRLSSVSGVRSATYGYDDYGNIVSGGGNIYDYDSASNFTCFNCADSVNKIVYAYDGLNQRVSVTKAGAKTYEVYGAHGNLLVEYRPSPSQQLTEYIYLGGKRIAQVQSRPTTTSLTSSPAAPAVNQAITLAATVSGTSPTGTVTFFDGGVSLGSATIASGQASKSVQFTTPGTRSITAQYGGDVNNDPSTSLAVSMDVGKTTATLSSSKASVNLNETFVLTATIAGNNPSGTVTFMDGGVSLGTATVSAGQASRTVALTTSGTHNVTAQYGGDTLNMGSVSSAVQVQTSTVSATSTSVSASANAVNTGVSVTFTASVTGMSPTGTVTFSEGSTTLGTATLASGIATFSASFATPGIRTIVASYGGNATNAASSGSVALTVNVPISQVLPVILQLLLED